MSNHEYIIPSYKTCGHHRGFHVFSELLLWPRERCCPVLFLCLLLVAESTVSVGQHTNLLVVLGRTLMVESAGLLRANAQISFDFLIRQIRHVPTETSILIVLVGRTQGILASILLYILW
jgi:hypothetical protein